MKRAYAIVLILALHCPAWVHAADIAWTPFLIAGDADVATDGVSVGAYNLGAVGVLGTSVNGVSFTPFSATDTTIGQFSLIGLSSGTNAGAGSAEAPFSALSPSYRTLLASYGAGPSLTLTMSGLAQGSSYLFQWWLNDSSSTSSADVTAGVISTVTLGSNPFGTVGGTGQFALGSFVADAPIQSVQFFGGGAAMLNAFQLRDVTPIPEPATYALMIAGLAIVGAAAVRRRKALAN